MTKGIKFLSCMAGVFILFMLMTLMVSAGSYSIKSDCSYSFNDYQKLLKKGQSITLVENAPSYALGGKFVKAYPVTVNRTRIMSCGYLYIRARGLDPKYGSIYINLQNIHNASESFGGHLLYRGAIPIPNRLAVVTEVLLPLNAISYVPHVPFNPDTKNFKTSNWITVLNSTDKVKFYIALSSLDTNSIIEEAKIVYK